MAKANGKKTTAKTTSSRTAKKTAKKTAQKSVKKTVSTAAPAAKATDAAAAKKKKKTTTAAKTTPTHVTKKVAVEAEAKGPTKKSLKESLLGSGKKHERQPIRCYLCGQRFEVSGRTMSTTCTACHKAIKVEDVQIKSYLPVNDLQTCGHIKITKRGRVAAKRLQSGRGIACEGAIEGSIETDGDVALGSHSSWKGKVLHCRTLAVEDGATLNGLVQVPWERE